MLKNYIKIAVRNVRKNKIYSLINILGLTIGIAGFLLIYLFINNELSYDNFHKDKDKIFRVIRTSVLDGAKRKIGYTSAPFADALINDFPEEIKSVVRVYSGNGLVTYKDKSFNEEKFYVADSNFFSFFSFPLGAGNPSTVLSQPNSLVISEKVAHKYFGDENPIGKILVVDKTNHLKITGISKEYPGNSHLDFDFVASISIFKNLPFFKEWWDNGLLTYVKLPSADFRNDLESKFPQFMDKYLGSSFRKTGLKTGLALEPLKDIYFDNDINYDPAKHGDKTILYVFTIISFFILLIACINFMNLSTAHASKRAKEVGLRKAVGAHRKNLIIQFLAEAFILTIISALLALAIVELSIPYFENFLGKNLFTSFSPAIIFSLLGIIVIVALIAGSYPAFVLSGFTPVKVLKYQQIKSSKSIFRQILVVAQFSISVVLIIGTLTALNQVNYIENKDLGFNKEQDVLVRIDNQDIYKNREAFKNELLTKPEIKNVSFMSGEPGGFFDTFSYKIKGKNTVSLRMNGVFTDYDYIKNLGLQIIEGRDFSRNFSTDRTEAVILNEKAVKFLGWSNEQAIGKEIINNFRDSTYRKVIGIVKDFHFKSLKDDISPLVIAISNDNRAVSIRLNTAIVSGAVSIIKAAYGKAAPQYPFEYKFLDESFDSLYKTYEKQIQIFTIFAFLAIFIACLGLFGLASYTSELRTKEIGIRKVLGASLTGILTLLSKEYLKLIFFSNIIAWPVAYILMNRWLQDFAYKIRLNFETFILSGFIILFIAIATISVQIIKTAKANPIKSLKYE